jgi:hypothetical protein
MIADAIDVTPVLSPVYSQTYFDRPKTLDPIRIVTDGGRRKTDVNALTASVIRAASNSTSTVADLTRRSSPIAADAGGEVRRAVHHSQLRQATADRVKLLARKYGDKLDTEGGARLDILTQRIRKLNPRVTQRDLSRLATMVDEAEQISDDVASLRDEFNF